MVNAALCNLPNDRFKIRLLCDCIFSKLNILNVLYAPCSYIAEKIETIVTHESKQNTTWTKVRILILLTF